MLVDRIIKQKIKPIVNFSAYFSFAAVSIPIVVLILLLSSVSTALVYYLPQQQMVMAQPSTTDSSSSGGNTPMTSATTQRSNTFAYEHPTCKIRIQYPSDWLRDAEPATSDYIVAFVPVAGINATAGGFENVKVKLINSQGMSLDQYTSIASKAFGSIPNSKVVQSGKTPVGRNNSPGFGVTYSVVDPNTSNEIRSMEVWSVVNNIIYDITYDASAANYAIYLPLVKAMISTLEVGAPSQQCISQLPTIQSLVPPEVISTTTPASTTTTTNNQTK
jgi:hypothetical protein